MFHVEHGPTRGSNDSNGTVQPGSGWEVFSIRSTWNKSILLGQTAPRSVPRGTNRSLDPDFPRKVMFHVKHLAS